MSDKELINIVGGGISATLFNAISRAASTLLDLGRSIGTSIRMLVTGKRC